MAETLYFGVNQGGKLPIHVTKDDSTTSSDVELVVDNSKVSRLELLEAVRALESYIESRPTVLDDVA